MDKNRLLMIGLDGATWDVLKPLLTHLPNLKKVMEDGVGIDLESVFPPITGPAWLTLATGLSPEQTGVFDFLCWHDEVSKLVGLSSHDFAGRSFWDFLSASGKKVGLVGYPMLYPSYPVNGFMVAGIGASVHQDFTWPLSLKEELQEVVPDYEIHLDYHAPRYEDVDLFLKDLRHIFAQKIAVAEHLVSTKAWDFCMVVLSETDWLQHVMWQYWQKPDSQWHQAFIDFWIEVDRAVGHLLAIVGPETNVMLVSDHGFGQNSSRLWLNRWLEQEGFLIRKGSNLQEKRGALNKQFRQFAGRIRQSIRQIAMDMHLGKIAPRFFDWAGQRTRRFYYSVSEEIDRANSLLYDPGHTIAFGGLYFGKNVLPEQRPQIIKKLKQSLEKTAKATGVHFDLRETNKDGHSNNSPYRPPDLLLLADGGGCIFEKGWSGGDIFEKKPHSNRHTGAHRQTGVLIAAGPDIAVGQGYMRIDASLVDIAPTILYLMGETCISDSMKGKVLTSLVSDEFMNQVNLPERKEGLSEDIAAIESRTDDEEAALIERLKGLGYL